MGLTVEELVPGQVIQTPEVFQALGWEHPSAIYLGVQDELPYFALGSKRAEIAMVHYPIGPLGARLPIPEFKLSGDKTLQKLRKAQLTKGNWATIRYSYASGTDPEFFVLDAKGKVIPARRFLPDKKAHKGSFFDGLQAEITPIATGCLQTFSSHLWQKLLDVQAYAQKFDSTARITSRNHFHFSSEEMASFTEEDLQFRCSTSLNIYDDAGELPDAKQYPWRFAGGHLHIGCGRKSPAVLKEMVRALDAIVGVAGVSLARNFDTPERRRMYGRAGEFRVPKHGLEYRVLSNFWLCSPLIYHLVFELMRYAYRLGEAGALDAVYEASEEEIRHCINRCDVQLALKLIKRNEILYTNIFNTIWRGGRASKKAMDTLYGGLEVAVKNPEDVLNNWRTSGSYPAEWGRTFA